MCVIYLIFFLLRLFRSDFDRKIGLFKKKNSQSLSNIKNHKVIERKNSLALQISVFCNITFLNKTYC